MLGYKTFGQSLNGIDDYGGVSLTNGDVVCSTILVQKGSTFQGLSGFGQGITTTKVNTILDTEIQPLLAEIEVLKLKQQQLDSGRQELLHYVLAQPGGTFSSEKILSFLGGHVELPVRQIEPEIVPEASPVGEAIMGDSNFLPIQPPPTNIQEESESGDNSIQQPDIASMKYSSDEDINHTEYVPPEQKYSFIGGETSESSIPEESESSSNEENTENNTLPVPPESKRSLPTPRTGKNISAFIDVPKKSDGLEVKERRNKRARELYALRKQSKGLNYNLK